MRYINTLYHVMWLLLQDSGVASRGPPIIRSRVLIDLMTGILEGFHHETIKREKGLAVIFIIHPFIKKYGIILTLSMLIQCSRNMTTHVCHSPSYGSLMESINFLVWNVLLICLNVYICEWVRDLNSIFAPCLFLLSIFSDGIWNSTDAT